MKEIGGRLQSARRQISSTQQEVAAELRVSRQAVSAWERGVSVPNALELRLLAVRYGVSADFLLFGVATPFKLVIEPRLQPASL